MSFETKIYINAIVLTMYICFLATSIIDQKGKHLFSSFNRIFLYYIAHVICCIVTDYFDYAHTSAALQYIFCTLYTVTGYLGLYNFGRYYVKTCGAAASTVRRIQIFNQIILLANLLFTLPLIPSGLFFSVSPDCYYTRGPLFFLSYFFVFLELISLSVLSFFVQSNKRKSFGYSAFGLLPIITSILMLFLPLPGNIADVASAISCSILYSCVYLEERHKSLENEAKITKYKTDVMLSQIRPHFLYNTLTAIAALCTENPEKAQTLTLDFSSYLRTNLNLANSERISSFADELAHTQKYLEIEKVRFGDLLRVEYDLHETDFSLPSLSLQPLVENAVKHGITQKADGGTVCIATEKRGVNYAVTVSDDGVGFDLDSLQPQDGHYGFANVKERVNILLGGSITIKSTKGTGTTVTILIPET